MLSVAKRPLALVSQDPPKSSTPPSNEELQGFGVEHEMGDDYVDEDAASMLEFSKMDLIDLILRNTNLSDEHPGLKFVLHFAKIDNNRSSELEDEKTNPVRRGSKDPRGAVAIQVLESRLLMHLSA